jgi:N-acetylmuramoyl-L-alanine amidase
MQSIIHRLEPAFTITKIMRFFATAVLWLMMAMPAFAAVSEISGYQLKANEDGSMIFRLKIDQMLDFQAFTLENPNRVVIDFKDTKWVVPKAEKPQSEIGFVKKLRAGRPEPETLRVVLDVSKPVKIEDSFIQVPNRKGDAHYLIVQMKLLQAEAPKRNFAEPAKPLPAPIVAPEKAKEQPKANPDLVVPPPMEPASAVPTPVSKPERFVIVIDPGHGGVDPGAIGPQGTKEKEITLRYAKHLRELLNATSRYEVVLTRGDDAYVPLRGRVKKSRDANAQLFISLHADSHPEANMHGLSVYTLSENASDKEAEALAERENKKDIITGVDLSAESKDIAEVLIDLARRDTKNTSARFAELVVAELGTEAKLLKNSHRFAGFAVLKGVGTPSALVELGYLSNPKEEAQLISREYEDKLVHAIARAVDTYCDQYAPKEQAQ